MIRTPFACEKGFSLLELMTVVAIVGILATMGMQSYQRFADHARQKEAKVALAAIYAAEKTMKAELGGYTVCLAQAGYQPPAGAQRYYTVGFWGTTVTNKNFPGSATPCTPATDSVFNANTAANAAVTYAAQADSDATNTNFKAYAWGSISNAVISADVWTIDETQNLVNKQPGF